MINLFLLNFQSKVPIYEQIKSQILKFIEAGILKPGDRLPSVRSLAQDNGINPNTVAKAYTELEKAGFVYNIPKKGVYVAEISTTTPKHDNALNLLQSLKDSDISKEEMLEMVNALFKEES